MVTGTKKIEFSIEDSLVNIYKMRRMGKDGLSIAVTLPRDFLEKLARKNGLKLDQFMEEFRAVVYYGGSDELLYCFERKTSGK